MWRMLQTVHTKKLLDLQNQVPHNPHRKDIEAHNDYGVINKARMNFLKQKVKQQWVKGVDANTAYFHACLKKRRDQNHIYRIKNMRSDWQDDPADIDKAFLEYYEMLLGNADDSTGYVSNTIINEGVVLSEEHQREICQEFTDEDV